MAPTTANHLARKSYVDTAAFAGEWSPADHGLAAWAFDPALAVSTGLYPGSGPMRVTALILRTATTINRIVGVAAAPATITVASMENGANRFWVGLA